MTMQETDENKNVPMVDIDTSGPEHDVEIKEEKQPEVTEETSDATDKTYENERETKLEEASPESQEASGEEKQKKEELENYSKDVQRRIAKLTGKWRDAQRQRDEAERQRDEAVNYAKAQSKKYTSLETESIKDRTSKIQSLLEAQKSRLAQAREASDINAEVDIQKEISRLGYEEARLSEFSNKAEKQSEPEQAFTQPIQTQQEQPEVIPDAKAEIWASKNRWFGTDKAMTYTAFDMHKTLVDEEGYDPKSDEYYTEIDKRLRVEFPHKFDTNNDIKQGITTKPVQTVASATRSTKSGRQTIRLTPSEVAIANKLGVSLEDYAKQKKIMKEV